MVASALRAEAKIILAASTSVNRRRS